VRSSDLSARSTEKKNPPSFFTFRDGLSWHIHALHCYLVHDIVLNFDEDGNFRTTKSKQKVMKSEARLVLLASLPSLGLLAKKLVMGGAAGCFLELMLFIGFK